tara:strand:- start:2699 stop:2875 length:177 start_codon:yes stop_codon:yes gene_type:complete
MAKTSTKNQKFMLINSQKNDFTSKDAPSKSTLIYVLNYAKSSERVKCKLLDSFFIVNN